MVVVTRPYTYYTNNKMGQDRTQGPRAGGGEVCVGHHPGAGQGRVAVSAERQEVQGACVCGV